MKFRFFKRIKTQRNSVFYSLIHYQQEILGFGKQHFRGRKIKTIKLNGDFEVIGDGQVFRGEDPRCFWHQNRLYLYDNYLNDLHLIDYETGEKLKIQIQGKNLSFISHNDKLYFIWRIKPFILYQLNLETGEVKHVEVNDEEGDKNLEYRGGTPGYKCVDGGEYYGFGHRTYYCGNGLRHDLFCWKVDFREGKPKLKLIEVEQPDGSQNICDPTSVIELSGKKYLITAESQKSWFRDQEYFTNVYEII